MVSLCNLVGMVKCIATKQKLITTQRNLTIYETIMIIAVARSRAMLTENLLCSDQDAAMRTLQKQKAAVLIHQGHTMCVKSLSGPLILTQCCCCSLQVELVLALASLPAARPGTSWLLAKGFMGCPCLLTNNNCEADCADAVMPMLT